MAPPPNARSKRKGKIIFNTWLWLSILMNLKELSRIQIVHQEVKEKEKPSPKYL